MRFYQVKFIILLMINISFISSDCDMEVSASKAGDCEDLEVDESKGEKYCCFVKGTSNNKKLNTCVPITEAQYKDIDQTIKLVEGVFDGKVEKLDCKSFYLQLGLISLIWLIL